MSSHHTTRKSRGAAGLALAVAWLWIGPTADPVEAYAAAPPSSPRPSSLRASAPPTSAAPQEEYPTTAGEAMRYYEGRVDEWIRGPVDYILENRERDIWDELETTEQKAAFIEWFWDRRDADGRAIGNPYKEEFYESVAQSNRRFRSFPRGWKSDQGHVYCVLGRPDAMTRQSWGSVYGGGSGPDFEVWRYATLGQNRAFQTSSGDFSVYFIETRIGNYEIYDFGFRVTGIWDRNIRTAFELTIEGSIRDPMLEFEALPSTKAFVREITEGTLPVKIPVEDWKDLGAGGALSVPVEVSLGDLLFVPEGDQFVAQLQATMRYQLAGGEASARSEAWTIRMGQDELAAVGNGAMVTAISAAAPVGSYNVEVGVAHPLAATDAEWTDAVVVSEPAAAAVVVGRLLLSLDGADPAAVAVLRPFDPTFGVGDTVVIGVWARGAQLTAQQVAVHLQGPDGDAEQIEPRRVDWLGGAAGPLVVEVAVPSVEAGEYRLHVDLGAPYDVYETAITIGR